MKIIIPSAGTIFIAISGAFFAFKHNDYGLFFALLGISCFFAVIYLHLNKNAQQKDDISTYLPGDSYEAISLEHPKVKLVMKSFSWKEYEFIHFIDIANLTGISLNTLTDIIKHLVDNKLITESKELKEHYELSLKGIDFVSSHKKELSKIKLRS